jgi:hypothetical protein
MSGTSGNDPASGHGCGRHSGRCRALVLTTGTGSRPHPFPDRSRDRTRTRRRPQSGRPTPECPPVPQPPSERCPQPSHRPKTRR